MKKIEPAVASRGPSSRPPSFVLSLVCEGAATLCHHAAPVPPGLSLPHVHFQSPGSHRHAFTLELTPELGIICVTQAAKARVRVKGSRLEKSLVVNDAAETFKLLDVASPPLEAAYWLRQCDLPLAQDTMMTV